MTKVTYNFIGFPNTRQNTFKHPFFQIVSFIYGNGDEIEWAENLLRMNKDFEYVIYRREGEKDQHVTTRSVRTGSGRITIQSTGHVFVDAIHDFENCPACNKQP